MTPNVSVYAEHAFACPASGTTAGNAAICTTPAASTARLRSALNMNRKEARKMFTPEELEELRRFDAEIDAQPMAVEDYQEERYVDRMLFRTDRGLPMQTHKQTLSPEMMERRRKKSLEWQHKHPEYKKAYYEENREYLTAKQREYYAAHREEIAAKRKLARQREREKQGVYFESKQWTDEMESMLVSLVENGNTVREIAEHFNRSKDGIRKALKRRGLKAVRERRTFKKGDEQVEQKTTISNGKADISASLERLERIVNNFDAAISYLMEEEPMDVKRGWFALGIIQTELMELQNALKEGCGR